LIEEDLLIVNYEIKPRYKRQAIEQITTEEIGSGAYESNKILFNFIITIA